MDELSWWERFRQEEGRKAERKEERRRQQAAEKQAQIERLQALPPLPRRAVPRPWEDLASVLSRTARAMGYDHPEWLLHPQDRPYRIDPAAVSLVSRDQEYVALGRQLVLEEHQIRKLTLHRFTSRFLQQHPPFPLDPLERHQGPGRPGLPYGVSRRFFLAGRETKACPHCLDEKEGYDRLYWRCTLILFCPRHQVFLLPHCPDCHAPIPALRPSRTQCPVCKRGEYPRAVYPVLSEDRWLQAGQAMLLRQLGIDEEEAEGAEEQVPSRDHTALADLLPWEYFQVLEQCFSFREILQLSSHEEEVDRFFLDMLPLESVVTRLSTALHQSPSGLLSPLLVHYLTSAWPHRFLVFQERLQRLLQDVFHYRRSDGIVQRWIQAMVKENFWCPACYHQSPVAHIRAFADVYRDTFHGLFPSESLHARHGQVLAQDRLVFEPAAAVPSQERQVSPYPWESLASLLARRGDAYPKQRTAESREPIEQLLGRRGPLPENLLTLQHQEYYRLLGDALSLDEATLYTLTLHRFTTAFQSAPFVHDTTSSPAFKSLIERPLLSQTTLQRACLSPRITKICPSCLKEEPVYERVYWNLKLVVLCPLHHCPLLDRCPGCHRLIPIFRPTPLPTCPYCFKDYRRTVSLKSVSPDSLLYKSQLVVLSMLGIHDKHGLPSLFAQSPLEELLPWHYFALLDRFGRVLPALRREKLLASLVHMPALSEAGLASLPEQSRSSAIHLCLFHALFLSWPQGISLILNSPDLQTAVTMSSSGTQDDQHQPDACYLALLHILTSMRRRKDQEILLQQEKRALSETFL